MKRNLLLPSLPDLTFSPPTLLASVLVFPSLCSWPFWLILSFSSGRLHCPRVASFAGSVSTSPLSALCLHTAARGICGYFSPFSFGCALQSLRPFVNGKLHYVCTVCPLGTGVSSPSVSLFRPVWLPSSLRTFALVHSVWDSASWLFVTAPWLLLIC